MSALDRRAFLRRTGAWTSTALLGQQGLARAQATSTPSTQMQSVGERLRLGFIGVGGHGLHLLNTFMEQPDVSVAGIADVYDAHAGRAAKAAADKGHKPLTCRDSRCLLDRKDIDAVVIATPDHWHAIAMIQACQAGKDVYVEKPLGYCIAEGRAMVDSARKHNRVTQMGIQMHATDNHRRVVEIVRSGMLGKIGKARIWVARNKSPGRGRPDNSAPPADCDYDRWLGPAPERPFNPLRFTEDWRWFWDYGGGRLSDMACHLLDPIYWALDLDAPCKVTAAGGRYVLDDICETPDTMEAVWEYGPKGDRDDPLQVVWSLTEGNARGFAGHGVGMALYGSNATVVFDFFTHEIIAEGDRLAGTTKPKPSIPSSPGHHREFLDAIKSRTRCSCDVEYGHRLSNVPHMANIAFRTGRTLSWDNEREQFIDAPEADRLLARAYRVPYVLPV